MEKLANKRKKDAQDKTEIERAVVKKTRGQKEEEEHSSNGSQKSPTLKTEEKEQ